MESSRHVKYRSFKLNDLVKNFGWALHVELPDLCEKAIERIFG